MHKTNFPKIWTQLDLNPAEAKSRDQSPPPPKEA